MRVLRNFLAGALAASIATSPLVALAQPGAGTPPPAAPNTQDAVGLSAQELEVLREAEAAFARYVGEAQVHHTRMRDTLLRELTQRQTDLEARYAERIASTEAEKRQRHLEAIALLEKFIIDHPDHQEFTPDAMFRLADLYLDESDYNLEQQELLNDPEADPIADYSKSVALWEQILAKFPNYRQIPGTLYLLAYYGKIKDERRSLLLFLALTCANKYKHTDPSPPELTREQVQERIDRRELLDPYADCQGIAGAEEELIRHAWVRGVGDHHFAVPGELDEAISAYKHLGNDKKANLFPESLYKLSWSYYRRDYLIEAIRGFDESVKIYDATVAKGKTPALELRDESLQYIAVSFTDPWEGELETDPAKGFERAREFYKGRENEPHVRDVWEILGRAFLDLQAYDQAVDSFRIALGPPWELNPANPVVHQEIVNALEAKGDKYAADEAAEELALRYAPGSAWYQANEKDRAAMENQRRIGERMLYAAARNMHSAATVLREEYEAGGSTDAAAKAEYLELYGRAIAAYKSFLKQYPDSEAVYDFTFAMGEAYYFSEQYMESVEHYRWVRDHRDLSEKYFDVAARSIISAYEAEAKVQVAAGTVAPLAVPDVAAMKALPKPIEPRPIPQIYQDLQREWAEYQVLAPDPKTAPDMGLNAALVSVAYLHLDDAITRFEGVMAQFCGVPQAVTAKDGLLAIYEARGEEDKFRETNDKFISSSCGDAQSIELAKSQNRSIEFRKAGEYYAAKEYIKAADAFYVYYKSAPAGDADLPTALYNSAIAFKLGERPQTAIHLFKEFVDNKEPAFRQSKYYLESLRLTAVSHQSVYDYKSAATTYLRLYDEAKNAKKLGLAEPEALPGEKPRTFEQIKLEALFNAAVIRELDRDFKSAVDLYKKYEGEESDRRNSDRALWAIARIYSDAGDINNLVSTYTAWRKKYGNDAGNEDDYVFSYYDTAKAYSKKGKTTDANKNGDLAIKAWATKGSTKNSRGAKLAGEYGLLFAERYFETKWLPYKISKTAKTEAEAKSLKAALDKFTKESQDIYIDLDKYGVAEYSMAAKVRFGDILSQYAQKLFAMPTPKYVITLNNKYPEEDLLAKYEEGLARNLAKYPEEAKLQWVEVVELAKKAGVSNEWTQRALEALNREFPDEFPVLRQELIEGTTAP